MGLLFELVWGCRCVQALPAYYSALKALDSLDKKQIQEVKSFANPPKAVGTVMAAVCLLLGKKETWEDSKKLLNDINFLTMLRDYDKVGVVLVSMEGGRCSSSICGQLSALYDPSTLPAHASVERQPQAPSSLRALFYGFLCRVECLFAWLTIWFLVLFLFVMCRRTTSTPS